MENAVATTNQNQPTIMVGLSIQNIVEQVRSIQELMAGVMKIDQHYGVIPGTGGKPTLLKPGAEKLCLMFQLAPEFQIDQTEIDGGHREYSIRCRLTHRPSGQFVAEGVGVCSTMESRYRYRKAERECPTCGRPSIIKGSEQYGGGWLCWKKKDGCGAKFLDGDESVEGQKVGRVEHPDPADYYNTAAKIAKKRAHVDATLTATAASDFFTQDVEDLPRFEQPKPAPEPEPKPKPRARRPKKASPAQEQIEKSATSIDAQNPFAVAMAMISDAGSTSQLDGMTDDLKPLANEMSDTEAREVRQLFASTRNSFTKETDEGPDEVAKRVVGQINSCGSDEELIQLEGKAMELNLPEDLQDKINRALIQAQDRLSVEGPVNG